MRQAREEAGLTQEALAKRAKTPRTTIARIEANAEGAPLRLSCLAWRAGACGAGFPHAAPPVALAPPPLRAVAHSSFLRRFYPWYDYRICGIRC